MELKILQDEKAFDVLKKEWSRLAEHSDSYIYQTYEWNRLWWKHFGKGKTLHLLAFYSENKLVGIAPLFQDTINFTSKTIYNVLRFLGSYVSQPEGKALLGSNAYSDYLDLIVETGYEEQVASKLTEYILKGSLIYDQILFNEVPENSVILTFLMPALNRAGLTVETQNSNKCVSILLDETWDSYLNRQSKNTRKKTRRIIKEIEKNGNGQNGLIIQEIDHSNDVVASFESLVELHQKQWNIRGFPGTFYEKRMHDFTKDICLSFYEKGWLQIKKLYSHHNKADTILNAEMLFTYKKRVYNLHGGMDLESPLLGKGLGNITHVSVLKEAIENHFEVFDYLRGPDNYKIRKGDIISINKTVVIYKQGKSKSYKIPFIKHLMKQYQRCRVKAIRFTLYLKKKSRILSG